MLLGEKDLQSKGQCWFSPLSCCSTAALPTLCPWTRSTDIRWPGWALQAQHHLFFTEEDIFQVLRLCMCSFKHTILLFFLCIGMAHLAIGWINSRSHNKHALEVDQYLEELIWKEVYWEALRWQVLLNYTRFYHVCNHLLSWESIQGKQMFTLSYSKHFQGLIKMIVTHCASQKNSF